MVEEETIPTHHEKVRIFAGRGLPEGRVEALREICQGRDLARLILTLKRAIPDYNPSAQLLGRALESVGVRRSAVGTG